LALAALALVVFGAYDSYPKKRSTDSLDLFLKHALSLDRFFTGEIEG